MSSDNSSEAEAADICCASCGIAEVDDVKLTECDGCDLVRYCSDVCQRDHRPEHEEECKERAVELRDEILFNQPEGSHMGDCPICSLPLPIDGEKTTMYTCCCKTVCAGCVYANELRQLKDNAQRVCPFCRHPYEKNEEEIKKNLMKRIAANDPFALCLLGKEHYFKGNYESAFKYYTKAVELGDVDAHYALSVMYSDGQGFVKDEKREKYHLEQAAIAGHACARFNLACYEGRKGRSDRAVKHLIIAASLGDDDAIRKLKECYRDGDVSKEDFAVALRGHHAAVKATKSQQREEGELRRNGKSRYKTDMHSLKLSKAC
jgi:tetratricopeptide (TPR) repeat protein